MARGPRYKRRQAAPGVKISQKNFGRDRRYPITNKFREELGSPSPKFKSEKRLVKPTATSGSEG